MEKALGLVRPAQVTPAFLASSFEPSRLPLSHMLIVFKAEASLVCSLETV